MFFPIGDDNIHNRGIAYVSYTLIIINILVYIFLEMPYLNGSEAGIDMLFRTYGAEPCKIMKGQELPSIISSMFMHGSLMHIFGNMLFLWIFGDNIELTIGHFQFLFFYIFGGVVAAYTHAYFDHSTACTPMVGASGAIAAVMGAYLVMYPKSKIRIFVLFLLRSVFIPSWIFLAFWGAQEIYSSYKGISFIKEVGDSVAHMAHAGGFIFGLICGLLLKSKTKQFIHSNS